MSWKIRAAGGAFAVLALAGCGVQAAGVQPLSSAAPAATVAPLSFACDVTGTGGATPAVQFTVTATASTLTNVSLVSVVFTDSAGNEVTSNPAVTFLETIPAGQSVTANLSSDGGAGITSCDVASWS